MADIWKAILKQSWKLKVLPWALLLTAFMTFSACERNVRDEKLGGKSQRVHVNLGTVELLVPSNCFVDKPEPTRSRNKPIKKEELLLQFIWPKADCQNRQNEKSFQVPGYGERMIVLLQRSGSKYSPDEVFHRRLITALSPGKFTGGEGHIPKPSKFKKGEQYYDVPESKLHPDWQKTIIASVESRSIAYCTRPPMGATSPFALGGCRLEWYDDKVYYRVSFGPGIFDKRQSIKTLISQKMVAFRQGVK